jgi:hypothetical protein
VGLDKPENKPNCEPEPTAVGVSGSHEGESAMGGRAPTRQPARAPGAATSRAKKKIKRDGRLERKALARRVLERRVRAQLEGRGSVAEANKLIDDLREASMQEFRDLMPPARRGP